MPYRLRCQCRPLTAIPQAVLCLHHQLRLFPIRYLTVHLCLEALPPLVRLRPRPLMSQRRLPHRRLPHRMRQQLLQQLLRPLLPLWIRFLPLPRLWPHSILLQLRQQKVELRTPWLIHLLKLPEQVLLMH